MSADPAQQGAQKSSDESTLAFWPGLAVPLFYSVILHFCRAGVLLGARRGRGLGAGLASGCSLDSEPARGLPCLLRRLLSGQVHMLCLCCGASSTLHRREIHPMGPTKASVVSVFGVSS